MKNQAITQADTAAQPSQSLRKRVIITFFTGLLFLAALTVTAGWVVEWVSGWGVFSLGWLNQALGSLACIAGAALVVWSVYTQYNLGRGTPAPRVATQVLVTQGPYAYTRNPMTLGAFWVYFGIGFWMGSGAVILLTVVVFSFLLSYIYVHETRELSERFGDDYLEYKRNTPFLLPLRLPKHR